MNIKNYFLGACAALAFTACASSDDIAANEQPVLDEKGNGYVSFSIQLPKVNTSRGWNDQFDEGSAFDYAVNNVALLIFTGTSEENAVYQEYVGMDDINFGTVSPGTNVSLDKKYLAKIKGLDLGSNDKIYALAVINGNQVFSHLHSEIGGVNMQGKKFSDLQDIIVKTSLNANENGADHKFALQTEDGGILMLNAPLSTTQGSTAASVNGATYTILQNVTESVKDTEAAAAAAPCANIYVERAVAKVTVGYAEGKKTVSAANNSVNTELGYDYQGWWLDNTNTESYVVRNMSNWAATYDKKSQAPVTTAQVYRMIGKETVAHSAAISEGTADSQNRYRTYFAIDPNYDKAGKFNHCYNNFGTYDRTFGDGGNNAPIYCAENVFNVEHQIWGETTRVLVGVKLTPKDNTTLYAQPGDEKFLTEEQVKIKAFNAALAKYVAALQPYKTLLTGEIKRADATIGAIDNSKDEVTVTLPAGKIVVAAGVTDAQVQGLGIGGITTKDQLEAAVAAVEKTYTVSHKDMGISYYAGGVSYYQVRIKHFGDELTPWNVGEDPAPTAGMLNNAYPASVRDNNYLGRYGVLRNNWYEIRLTGIAKIGYANPSDLRLDWDGPEDPDYPRDPEDKPNDPIDPNTPDDHLDKEQWISAEVNILSWAKRLQNNNLGED